MKAVQSVLAILLALVIVSFSQAETIYVDDDNAAGPWHGTFEHPYQRIQDGIDAAWHGNTVLVRDGMYRGAGNVNLDFHGKAITVKSGNGADNCIIDCEDVDGTRGFYFHSGEGLDSVVDGFTIRDALAQASSSGGITCLSSSSPTIMNNVIRGCWARYGGGIYCNSSSPTIASNTIEENVGTFWGGGIYCEGNSSPTVVSNTIKQNGGADGGGGILCDSTASPVIEGNFITENASSELGAGVICRGSGSFTVTNNTVRANSVGYAYWGGGGVVCTGSGSFTINSNIVMGNSIDSYYTSCDAYGGGIYCEGDASFTITNNTIIGNSVGGDMYTYGGGIYCEGDTSFTITSNTIIGNSVNGGMYGGYGGGIYCEGDASLTIANNTIAGNSVHFSEEICPNCGGGGILCTDNTLLTITNTILWENTPQEIYFTAEGAPNTVNISYSDVRGGQAGIVTNDNGTVNWGDGNMDADPLFVDMANDDYHLRNSSSCIGRGIMTPDVPDKDIEGNPRPNPPGSNPDMGAYENSLPAPSVPTTLIIQAFSPADLVVTDPKLRTIDKGASTIPYAAYIQTDLNGDGDPDDGVFIPDAVFGNYSIQVMPEQGVNPTNTYTLDVSYGDETVRLAENVPIGDIPADPYIFFYPLLDMEQGWNLISFPLQPPDKDPGAVLSSISGSYNSVWAFDPGAGWTVYAPGVPIGLERMEPDRGYWIKMDGPGSLIVQGADPEQTDISLRGGEWNLVGYSSRTSRNAEDCMSQVENSINSVWEHSAKDEDWFIYMPGGPSNLEVMRPGVGYWVKADQKCVWDVNATTQLAAPTLALRSSRGFASADRPEIPYMVWGSVEIDGVKVTDKDTTYHTPITVTLEIDGEVQYSCTLRASDRCGDFYVLYVPSYMNSSAQPELYVRMDGNVVKAFPIPVGQPGEMIRFDLPIRIAPEVSLLCQNYPNPFNPDTWIPYQLREDNDVMIMIYASTGRLVRTLDLGRKPAGFYTDREKAAYWDGKNEAGEYVASGVYFYSIKAGDLTATRKMVIVR